MASRAEVANQKTEQRVQGLNTQRVRWDDLRTLLAVAEGGSFRAAAQLMKVSVNTVRSAVLRLEDAEGTVLLDRSAGGVTPTRAGTELLALAARFHAETAERERDADRLRSPGEIRIGASEALGSGWLTPRLMDLQQSLQHLTVTLLCDYDVISDRSGELDVGIAWHPPANPELIVSKLATLHFMPFASRRYIAEHGVPRSADELLQHRYVEQIAPGVKSGLLDQIVGIERPPGFIPIRTNSSLALFHAVVSGAGIAFMPTYAAALTRHLVPIDIQLHLRFDLLYFFHADARESAPVRTAIDWLRSAFDPAAYPCFRSEFVHPAEAAKAGGDNVVRLFEPFL